MLPNFISSIRVCKQKRKSVVRVGCVNANEIFKTQGGGLACPNFRLYILGVTSMRGMFILELVFYSKSENFCKDKILFQTLK